MPTSSIVDQWKALNPQERKSAMSRMSSEQKMKLASALGYKGESESPSPTESTDISGRTPTGEPAPGDKRNAAQRWLDNLITPDPRHEEWQSPAKNTADDVARHVAQNFIPILSHPLNTMGGMVKSAGQALANNPDNAQGVVSDLFIKPIVEQVVSESQEKGPTQAALNLLGTGAGMWASSEIGGAASRPLGKVARRLADTVAEARRAKYAPREILVGEDKIPVAVGEAAPESKAGRTQAQLKRSGSGAAQFEKLEATQQEAVKNTLKKTAMGRTAELPETTGDVPYTPSEFVGPMQEEAGAVMDDAATASFRKAAPLYDALDSSLREVPANFSKVSKIVQDAIAKARKLGIPVEEGEAGADISKIRPDKNGAIQWGGSKISKASHPERWAKLVSDGIIDDSGNGTPIRTYRMVRSQLLKMQRSATDGATRHAIGNEVAAMDANIHEALKGTEFEKTFGEANRLWRQGHARIQVADAVKDATKGTPASVQAGGMTKVPTKLQGASLVDKLNTLADEGVLADAYTPEEVRNLRQSADILDRIQKTPVGKGAGESMSFARGLTHAVRGFKGPMIGAGIGAGAELLSGGSILRGAEMGAGIGFIVQSIGERALVKLMTTVDGVKGLKAVESAKTPIDYHNAIVALSVGVSASALKGPKARELQRMADEQRNGAQ